MKKLILLILFLLCFSNCEDYIISDSNRPQDYIGIWTNKLTLVNGTFNDGRVPEFDFLISQDGAYLYFDGIKQSGKYIDWKVNANDSLLYFMNSTSLNDSDLVFKVLLPPTITREMTLCNADTIIYCLYEN
jgi:hypothetical protein